MSSKQLQLLLREAGFKRLFSFADESTWVAQKPSQIVIELDKATVRLKCRRELLAAIPLDKFEWWQLNEVKEACDRQK